MTLLLLITLAQVQFGPPPSDAEWEAAKCRTEADRVSCGLDAFKVLTDSLIEGQAEVEKLQLQLTAKDVQLEALKAALLAKPVQVVQVTPVYSNAKPIVAVVTAVLGTAAMTASLTVDTLAPGTRIGLGITGAAAVAGSFVIVF